MRFIGSFCLLGFFVLGACKERRPDESTGLLSVDEPQFSLICEEESGRSWRIDFLQPFSDTTMADIPVRLSEEERLLWEAPAFVEWQEDQSMTVASEQLGLQITTSGDEWVGVLDIHGYILTPVTCRSL